MTDKKTHEEPAAEHVTSPAKLEEPVAADTAVAVSVRHLRSLLHAAEKHAAKDDQLAAALAHFTGL